VWGIALAFACAFTIAVVLIFLVLPLKLFKLLVMFILEAIFICNCTEVGVAWMIVMGADKSTGVTQCTVGPEIDSEGDGDGGND
jgi:hypothetical protein